MASAGKWSLSAAAVERVLEVLVDWISAVRVVLRSERRGVVELHVGPHGGDGKHEGQENGLHVCG